MGKKSLFARNSGSSSARAAFVLAAALILTTCDAFKAGLGPKIDISSPTVDVNSIANGSYLKGVVLLTGVCADDVGVQSVTVLVTVDSVLKGTLAASLTGGTWSASLDTVALSGGLEVQADLAIRITDGTGKTTDKRIVVYFDNVIPVLTSMSPTADNLGSSDYALSEQETISGSVKDGLGLAQLELIAGTISYKETAHPAAWSIVVDATQFYDGMTLAARNGAVASATYPGLYEVPYSVVASDLAGNMSVAQTGTLYINPDGAPIVDINGQTPAIDQTVHYFPNPPDFLDLLNWKSSALSPGDTIKFRVFDMDGLDTSPGGLCLYLIPGSKAGDLATLDLAPYTYTVGGAPGNSLSMNVLVKSDGTPSIPQKADFSMTLPTALTGAGGTMPELGEYMLLIHASDKASNKISAVSASRDLPPLSGADKYLSVYITRGKPSVTVAGPANGAFLNALGASGVIDDAFGVSAVSVSVDGSAPALAAVATIGAISSPWTYSHSGPALAEGLHSAAFVGQNVAGVSGQAQIVQFYMDTTLPTASVQSVAPASAAGTPLAFADDATGINAGAPGGLVNVVNGLARFRGLASDSAALASASWAIRRVSSTAPWTVAPAVIASGAFPAATMSLWTLDVDTTDAAYADGDYYLLSVTSTDQAGNQSAAAERTFRIVQASDLPTFSLQNMDSLAATSGQAKDNLLTTKIELTATVSDDDRLDPATLTILIDPITGGFPSPSGNPINDGYTDVTGSVNAATGNVSFTYSFTATGIGTGFALPVEGRHFFYLVVNDDSAWKGGKAAVPATFGPVWFAVDTHQPQISFAQVGGLYVSSSQALSGTVDSANALDDSAPFTIRPQGGSISSPALTPDASSTGSHSWSYNLDVSARPDGPLSVTATAKDEFGLSSVSVFSVTVDKTPPSIATTNPAQYFSDVNGYALLGTTLDVTSGVASITAAVVQNNSGAHGADLSASAPLTLSATAGSPNTSGNWSLDLSALATGSYFVALLATDKAGNVYSPAEFTVNVDKDLPVATVDNVLAAPVNGAVYNAASAMPASWTGTLSDAFFADGEVDLDGARLGAVILGPGAWSRAISWASVSEGSHSLAVRASDRGGHSTTSTAVFTKDTIEATLTISAPDSGAWLSASPYTIKGGADDGAGMGVERVYYLVDAAGVDHSGDTTATVLSTWTQATGSVSWSATINLAALGEGTRTLWARSLDKAGNWNAAATTVDFGVDLANPRATETNHTGALIQSRVDVSFAGTADDAAVTALRAASSAVLSWSKDGGTATDVALTPAADGAWSWTLVADPNGNGDHSGDGLYAVALRVTDAAGKTSTVNRTAQIDTTAPTLVVAAPVASEATANNSYAISGTSRDTGGVGFPGTADVEYKLGTSGTWLPLTLTGTSWSGTAALGIVEGAKTLNFRSTDRLGNVATQDVGFYYDLSDPVLTETAVHTTDTQYRNANLAFGGLASDTNALASLSVSVNGGAPQAIAVDGGTHAWAYTFDVSSLADGAYALVFTAMDAANKTTGVSRSVVVDTTLPTVSGITDLAGWRTAASLSVSGSASDGGSGLDRVEYQVNGGPWSNFTGTAGFSGTISFAEGSGNVLNIRAADKAGNVSVPIAPNHSQQTVMVDTNDPTLDVTSPASSPALNGASPLSITVNATDTAGGSLLSSVSAYTYDSSTATNGTTRTVAAAGASATVTLVMPAADILALTEGTRRIYVRATDAAGRNSSLSTITVLVDKTAPTLSFSSHAELATVNKLVDLAGSSSDANGIALCVAQVWNAVLAAWEAPASGAASGTTSWSHAGFDTGSISAAGATYDSDTLTPGLQLRLRALATDAAGNTASAVRTLLVDQHSDRPVVKLTNLPTLDGTTTLRMSRTVFGTVSDDDGAATRLEVSENGSTWTDVTLDGGTWSCDASAGDGDKYLYFRVTDAKLAVFATDTAPTETIVEPRIWLTAAPTYAHDRVAFKVDTVAPELAATSPITVDRTGTDFTDAADLANNMAFGGTTAQFAVRTLASDANGIATVRVTVPGAPGSPFAASANGPDPVQTTFTRFDTGTIDVASVADGSLTITIEVTDNSGLKSTATRSIIVDNSAPTINFINPATASMVNGNLDITGTAADSGSGLSTVTYRIGLNYASEGALTPNGTKFLWDIPYVDAAGFHDPAESFDDSSTGTHIYVLPIIVRAADYAGNARETVPVSGTLAARPGTTTLQAASLAAEPNRSLVKVGQAIIVGTDARIITAFDQVTGTVTWAGAVALGSTSYTIFEYCLRVNPNADLPVAAISYPTNGSTMGGNVRMYGTALDDDGVSEVWMEIDTNGDGSFTAADDAIGGWYNGDSGKKVDGSANWNQTINQSHEFDPAGATPTTINVRVRARDIYGTWGPWTAPTMIQIDKNVPQIGSAVGLYLEKLGDPATTLPYTFGMCVKGDWTLRGSIEDDGAVSAIELAGSIAGTYALNPGWFSNVTPSVSSPGKYRRVDLQLPIATVAGSSGAIVFTLSAYDDATPTAHETIQSLRIAYDNQAPVASLAAPTTDSVIVMQSNGWYKVKGSTEDTGSDIDRVEVYFIRRGNGTTTFDRIYNPAHANRSAYLSAITIDADGSPLQGGTAGARTLTSLTDASLINNALINVGQKIVVGSLVRTVSAFTPATGRIDWNDGDVDAGLTAYSVRLAIQVEDKSTEVRDSGTGLLTTDDGDGYLEYLKQDSGNAYTWYVDINSANIPDGPIELHWVTYDKAGNSYHGHTPTRPAAGYYRVQNNGPRVSGVILGTDLNDSNGVTPDERQSFSFADSTTDGLSLTATGFTVKDGPMYIEPVVTNGNGDLRLWMSGAYTLGDFALRTGGTISPVLLTDADLTGTVGEGSRTFTLTIWDSTEETTPNVDSLSLERSFTCAVNMIDAVAPYAALRPFHWNSTTDNSLYSSSKANGHIEISGVYDGADPDVSGQLCFRGVAYDDQRITAIYAYLGNGSNDTNRFAFGGAASTKVFGGLTYSRVAVFAGSTLSGSGDADLSGANGWKFTVTDQAIDQTGHRTAWQLDWDSSRVFGTAATNQVLRIIVEDKRPTTPNVNSTTANANTITGVGTRPTNNSITVTDNAGIKAGQAIVLGSGNSAYFARIASYNAGAIVLNAVVDASITAYTIYQDDYNNPLATVDVVPYISGIARDSSVYSTRRSKLGKYPLQQSEGNILVTGFNLFASTTQDANNWIRIYSLPTGGNADADALTIEASPAPTRAGFEMTLNAASNSGYFRLAVSGVEAINNIDAASLDSNKEDDGKGLVATLWTDDRYLSLFQVGDYFKQSDDAIQPAMSLDVNANPDRLYATWSNTASGAAYVAGPNTQGAWANRSTVFTTYDPPEWTDLYVDADGQRHELILENFYGGSTTTDWGFLASYRNEANRVELDDMGDDRSTNVDHSDGYDEMLFQFRNPRIAVRSATNDVYASYYDYFGKCLKYSRTLNGAQTFVTSNGHMTDQATVVDGVDDFNTTPTTPDVGIWSDIQIDDIGGTDTATWRPVIAYYDTTNRVLKVARGTVTQPGGTAQWNKQTVPLSSNIGEYVSMNIDASGNIHIAAYKNSTGDLYYIHAANVDGSTSYVFSTPVKIDEDGAVGTWCDIDLNGTTPVISYATGDIGTYEGLKYAYVSSGNGQASADWEYMVVPVNSVVNGQRTSIVYSSDTASWDGNVAFGFGSTSYAIVYQKRQVP